MSELATAYAVSRPAIRGILSRRHIPLRPWGKLSEQQKLEIVERYKRGETSTALATQYGVSGPSITSILRRRGVVIRNHDRYSLWEEAFDELTADAAYWVGFLFADGTIHFRQGHKPTVAVGLAARDRGHLVKLRAFLRSNHAIASVPRTTPSGANPQSCHFSVRSWKLATRLSDMGRYDGPLDPTLIASRHFWRGLVDGDGSLGIYNGKAQFRVVGRRRILQPLTEFINVSSTSKLTVRPHKTITTVGTTGRSAERIVRILYENVGLTVLDRKAAIADAMREIHRKGPIAQ